MDVRVLGVVECVQAGAPVRLPGRSARAVLAMLALRPGEQVRTDELIDGMWAIELPGDPAAAIYVTVSRLRRALGADRDRLRRVPSGYVLDAAAEEVDLGRAEHALKFGGALLADDPQLALQHLDAGLSEWHGSPFAELADLPFSMAATSRAHLTRVALVEARNNALLRVGRPGDIAATTETVLRDDPWREDLVAQLMVAYYRTGRQADALAAYVRLASTLKADFGVEPTPALQDLRDRIVGHDPALGDGHPAIEADGGRGASAMTKWFRAAIDELGGGSDDLTHRSHMLLALGRAEHDAGEPGWRATLLEAGASAMRAGDRATVAQCALAGAMGWSVSPGRPDADRLELISFALQAEHHLPDGLHARLLAARTIERAGECTVEERLSATRAAIELARSTGEPTVLLATLNLSFSAIWAPATLAQRRLDADEAAELADLVGTPIAQAIAAGWAMAAAVEAGDIEAVDRHLTRFRRLADTTGAPFLQWGAAIHGSWRAALDGDLAAAEVLADRGLEVGRRAHRPEAELVHLAQCAAIRWAQGRLGEEAGPLDRAARATGIPALQPLAALAAWHAGDVDRAGGLIDHAFRQGRIAALPQDQLYLAGLAHWAELADRVAHAGAGAEIHALLAPYADHTVFTGSSVYGPVKTFLVG